MDLPDGDYEINDFDTLLLIDPLQKNLSIRLIIVLIEWKIQDFGLRINTAAP